MYIFCSNVKYEFPKTVYLYKTDAALAMTKSLLYIQWLLSYIKEFHELGIHFYGIPLSFITWKQIIS